MRILHVVPSYLPAYRYGGPIVSVHEMNKELVRQGASVTVFTTDADGSVALDVPVGVPVDRDGVTVFYFPRSFPKSWFYSSALRRALREHVREFDLVHITSVFLAASTLAARYARKARRPYFISPRGSLMREPLALRSAFKKRLYLSFVERRNLAGAAAIHFTAEVERAEYAAAGLPLRRSIVVPNGVDVSPFKSLPPRSVFRKRWGIPDDARVILFMGRVNWKKGLDTLIPAFSILRRADPRAVLVLDGAVDETYEPEVRTLMRANGLDEAAVVRVGEFRGLDLEALAASDCFVLTSYAENFGMAVAQALAAGVPVVVTRHVGIAPEIERAGAGIVIEKNVQACAEAMERVLRDPAAASDMAARGQAFVRERFSWQSVATALLREYNTIA